MAETDNMLTRASQDLQTIEDFVNLPADTVVNPRLLPSVNVGTLAGARQAIFEAGGLPATPFSTQALMTASALVDGVYAVVTNDTLENNGLYIKTAGAWVKSAYDPLSQAKADATVKADAAVTEALAQVNVKIEIDTINTSDIIDERDANGVSVRKVTKDGKHLFIGLDYDLATELNRYATHADDSDNIFEQRDSNEKITFKQDKNGDLHALRVGNITQTLLDLQSEQNGTPSNLNLEAKHLAGKYADYTLAETTDKFTQEGSLLTAATVQALGIFDHIVTKLRIPAVTRVQKSKYLLFFEARENYDDFCDISQGVATIDIDTVTKVATVSNIKALHKSFTDAGGKLRAFMNACAVKLANGRTICIYIRRYGSAEEHETYMRYSDDDGVTWSAFEDISYVIGDNDWGIVCPCSKGIVKQYGQHKGRVVFPVWESDKNYTLGSYRSGYIYSDDNGLTWSLGEFAPYVTANEVQVAEDLNGDMIFSIRMENNTPVKILARHSDKTKEYEIVDANITFTGQAIMSGLVQGENSYDFSANKIQMSTCYRAGRRDLAIHTTYDGGENWRTHVLPSTVGQPVAYSCIENLTATHKFVMWEADDMTNFNYAVIALKNLIEVA